MSHHRASEIDGSPVVEIVAILVGIIGLTVLCIVGIFSKKVRAYNHRKDIETSYSH